jgi:hypothetical protein
MPGPLPQPLPPGTYSVAITQQDLARAEVAPSVASALEGAWELKLGQGGDYSLARAGAAVMDKGRFTSTPDGMVLAGETADDYGCNLRGEQNATYQSAFDGQMLALTAVEDPCPERKAVLTLHPWSKAATGPPLGAYTKTITLEDTAADEQMRNYADRSYFLGPHELTLAESNRYSMVVIWQGKQIGVVQTGHYTVTLDGIVFSAEEQECAGTDGAVGTYQWALDGQGLTLKAVEDLCYTRKFFHTVHPWSKADYERPLGTYAIIIAEEDIPAGVRDDMRAGLPGRWELTLDEQDRFSLAHDGATVSQGGYTLAQGVLRLAAEHGECTGVGETGNYQWALDGNALTLTAGEDWCDKRNAVFTLRPLTKLEVLEAASTLPLGNYVTTITLEDTSADDQIKGIPDRNTLPGDWQLTLAEGNHYTFIVVRDGKLPIVTEEGRYTLTPDRIAFEVDEASCPGAGQGVGAHELTLHGDAFCYVCGAAVYPPSAGAYQWALIANTLTMTATELEDPCLERRFVSTAHGWSKVEYELPVGAYTTTIAEGEVPVGVPVDLQAALPGQWELSLAQGQRFSVAHDGTSLSQGHYHLTQKLMVLTAEQGECTGYGEEGAYQWAFDGQMLSLTAVQDWCDKRNAVFTLRPLTRSESPKAVVEPEVAATPLSSSGIEQLAGLWQDAESGTYLQLGADGTFRLAVSPAWLEASPLDLGQFRLEGALLTLSSSADSHWCVHQQGSYQIELTRSGELRFELWEDPCQNRALSLPAGHWSRVEP